jgi:hypothetical protein
MSVAMEKGKWKTKWTIIKYDSEEDYKKGKVAKIEEYDGNILLNEGINLIWTLVCGGSGTPFNSANAYIGVGDSTTAESATQTGLQAATNKLYKPMDSGYPIYGSNQQAIFQATFGASDANFTWNEITVANGGSDSAVNLNRKVVSMGTKASGAVWTARVTITIS